MQVKAQGNCLKKPEPFRSGRSFKTGSKIKRHAAKTASRVLPGLGRVNIFGERSMTGVDLKTRSTFAPLQEYFFDQNNLPQVIVQVLDDTLEIPVVIAVFAV